MMKNDSWHLGHDRLRGMYRDRENGWVFGVCSGLAAFGNFRTGTVRLITFVCLLLFFWPTVLLYMAATMLFKEKPLIYSGTRAEYEFWRRDHDRWTRS